MSETQPSDEQKAQADRLRKRISSVNRPMTPAERTEREAAKAAEAQRTGEQRQPQQKPKPKTQQDDRSA